MPGGWGEVFQVHRWRKSADWFTVCEKKINSLVHKVSVFTWHLHVMLFLHKLVLRGHFFKLQETPACYQRHSLWSPDRALIIWRTTVPQIKLYICKWRYEHWLYILYISIFKKKSIVFYPTSTKLLLRGCLCVDLNLQNTNKDGRMINI